MKIRRIILEQDYPVFKTWFDRRGVAAPVPVLLPAVGVLAETDEAPVACAWLYEDKAGLVGMVEWEATNPDSKGMTALRGLNQVFDFFEGYCRANGIRVIMTWVKEGRGDGRLLVGRSWKRCHGDRHELMVFEPQSTKEVSCP